MEKTINEIKIDVPEGMEAYLENDTIKFRLIKKFIYDNIAEELFYNKTHYIINSFGKIADACSNRISYIHTLNTKTEKQAKKLLAINQLMNVAKYLNGDWQPDWDNKNKIEYKYYLYIDYPGNKIEIAYVASCCSDGIYFKSEEIAQQAIEILGEETIKLALCTDW